MCEWSSVDNGANVPASLARNGTWGVGRGSGEEEKRTDVSN